MPSNNNNNSNNNSKNDAHIEVIRNRMIHDPESTEVMLYMVKNGQEALKTVHNYNRYRQVLAQQIHEEDYFQERRQEQKDGGIYNMGKNRVEGGIHMINKYVCGKEDAFDHDEIPSTTDDSMTMDHRVDIYIEEVLRFLAMKIFLENGLISTTTSEEGENVDPNAHGATTTTTTTTTETMLNHYNNLDSTNVNGLPILQLHPSQPIRYGWKMMLLFPLIYADVCAAMGSPSHLDYSSEEEDDDDDEFLNDVLSTKMWKLECYHWTLDTYDNLFHGRPSRHFWPMVKMDMTRKGEFIWNETRDCKCLPVRVTPQSPTARSGYVTTSSESTTRRKTTSSSSISRSKNNKLNMNNNNGASVSSINPREILDKVQKPIMEGYERWREPCVTGGMRARDTCQAFDMRDEGTSKPWRDQSSIPECINVKYR